MRRDVVLSSYRLLSNNRFRVIKEIDDYLFNNNIPVWTFGFANAKLVIENCMSFSNMYSMLKEIVFIDGLCLHTSISEISSNPLNMTNDALKNFNLFRSNLSDQDFFRIYIESKFNYFDFVRSAFIYYLKHCLTTNSKLELIIFATYVSNILMFDFNTLIGFRESSLPR